MVHPIQPGGPAGAYQDRTERQRIFELQWEISLIGSFLAASNKNSQFGAQCSKIKNDVKSGVGSDKIASELNFLIGKINQTIPNDKAPFPLFHFSDTDSTKVQALKCFVMSFEKYLLILRETHQLDPLEETHFWNEAQKVFSSVNAHSNAKDVFNKLEGLIEEVNKVLPTELHVPSLPNQLLT